VSPDWRHLRPGFWCLGVLAACGGTTQGTGPDGRAGTTAGGSVGSAGTTSGGTVGSAGKPSGGSSAAGQTGAGGTSSGGAHEAGSGGIVIITPGGAVGMGGSAPVDARCPAQRPDGACKADDAGLSCQYSVGDNCLCYPTAPGTFTFCQKVDPTCPQINSGGTSSGGSAGAGGASAKVALPPRQRCTCTAGTWSCTFGT